MKTVVVVIVLLGVTVVTHSADLCTASIPVNRGYFWACLDVANRCITAHIEYPGIAINPSMTICQQQNTDGSTCYRITSDNICSDVPMLTRLTLPKPDLSDTMVIVAGFQSSPPKVCFEKPQGECNSGVTPITNTPEPDVDEDDGNGGVPENVSETGTSQMEPADRKAIVNQHNKLRRTTKPTPANMKKMSYNRKLERFAQNYLNGLSSCPLQHNPNNRNYGENVYIRSAWGSNVEKVDYKSVVTLWYDEIAYYNFNTRKCTPPPGESCGHYTQVVWDDTTKVGCGVKECVTGSTTKTLVLCNYDPPGNVIPYGDETPRQPYIKGSACSRCPSSHDTCVNKLCVSKSELELETLSELMALLSDNETAVISQEYYHPGEGVQEWEMGQEDKIAAGFELFEEYPVNNEEFDEGGFEFKVSANELEAGYQSNSGWETFVI